jgi:phosphoglycolate phosphatase-like HAD superfamily hydrolase
VIPHIVWDWNGTLLDDLAVVVEAVNVGLIGVGVDPIDADGYRTHYTRPVSRFYASLLGRPVRTEEWQALNEMFHQAYFGKVDTVGLTADARRALDLVHAAGATQSVLSMAPHDHLVPIVMEHRLHEYFTAVRGSSGNRGEVKAESLEAHLIEVEREAGDVVVIGDTPDDAAAAHHVGADAVLYDGGSHHLPDLEAVGVPVASTLVEAVRLALE